jgi:aminopeptidase N
MNNSLRRGPWCLWLSLMAILAGAGWCAAEEFRAAADRPVDVRHIRLELEVSIAEKTVAGLAVLEFAPIRPLRSLTLDAVGHEVEQVLLLDEEGNPQGSLEFENTGEELQITFPEVLERDQLTRIGIPYRVREPRTGLHFFMPTDQEPDLPRMVWSQGEPVSNRHWFPCLDNPNQRQTTELLVTVDPRYEVLSNGRLVSREEIGEGEKVRFHWKQDKPHVSYLVTLVVGEFDVTREEWRGRPVTYYVPKHLQADVQATFGRTIPMLDHFSDLFGIEYPWDQYAQVVVEQFIAGGMENTSATTLYEAVLHDERALLDGSPDWLIAHELGHQWWGDLVTCKDWTHLWLNEGFATYCEILWAEHHLGREEADYRLLEKSRAARSGAALTRPIVDYFYPHPRSMFDVRAYPKGGWVLHMLRHRLGDEDFFKTLQRYGTLYAYQTAETSDLRQTFSELTGLSLERFFHDWTARPGHPVLKIDSKYEPDDRLVRVRIEQEQQGEPFAFPLAIELTGQEGQPLQRIERDVTEQALTIYIPASSRPAGIRIDPEFSLLAEIKERKSRDWWEHQLSAPTIAERVRAIEHFADGKSSQNRELLAGLLADEDQFYGVKIEAARALGRSGGESSRDALIAALSGSAPRVRAAAARALGEFREDEQAEAALQAVLERDEPAYSVVAESVRALGKIARDPSADLFVPLLERDSHREQIRIAALGGLSRVNDPSAFETLLAWTTRGHPPDVRREAITSVAGWVVRQESTPRQQEQVVEQLAEYLVNEGPRTRRAAATALGSLGAFGREAVGRLDAVARHDVDQRARDAARSAAEKIRSSEPTPAGLQRLRSELDRLKERNEQLEDRLERLEAK